MLNCHTSQHTSQQNNKLPKYGPASTWIHVAYSFPYFAWCHCPSIITILTLIYNIYMGAGFTAKLLSPIVAWSHNLQLVPNHRVPWGKHTVCTRTWYICLNGLAIDTNLSMVWLNWPIVQDKKRCVDGCQTLSACPRDNNDGTMNVWKELGAWRRMSSCSTSSRPQCVWRVGCLTTRAYIVWIDSIWGSTTPN